MPADKPIVPEHEPELIAARVAKGPFREDEKVATTSLAELDFRGVKLLSRYGKAKEYREMVAVLERLDASTLERVFALECDSKSTTYVVTLYRDSNPSAEAVARQFDAAFVDVCGGHNGIWFRQGDVDVFDLDPRW